MHRSIAKRRHVTPEPIRVASGSTPARIPDVVPKPIAGRWYRLPASAARGSMHHPDRIPRSSTGRRMKWAPIALAAVLWLLPAPGAGQSDGDWNSARALELIERARQRRASPEIGSALRNYRARANGYVYFYLDRESSDETTLVKVDQIALDVYWGAPNLTKQRIIGLRDVNRLPNRMYYHLDHLTVVQNEFSDLIRLGDGDEVRDVPHPAAPGSEATYDFRLADSLTIQLPSSPEPVRVYEIEVRPR